MPTITPTTGVEQLTPEELNRLPGFDRKAKKTLDQEDFLKLLSTQLANQDPLEPQKDTAFIAQMASFSTNEQLGAFITTMKAFTAQQKFTDAQNYLGKWVSIVDGRNQAQGIVSAVGMNEAGEPLLTVGDNYYSPDKVIAVRSQAPQAPAIL